MNGVTMLIDGVRVPASWCVDEPSRVARFRTGLSALVADDGRLHSYLMPDVVLANPGARALYRDSVRFRIEHGIPLELPMVDGRSGFAAYLWRGRRVVTGTNETVLTKQTVDRMVAEMLHAWNRELYLNGAGDTRMRSVPVLFALPWWSRLVRLVRAARTRVARWIAPWMMDMDDE